MWNHGRFCEPFDEIYSTGNKLYVKLKTDDSKTESWNHGFKARFESMEFLGKAFSLSIQSLKLSLD